MASLVLSGIPSALLNLPPELWACIIQLVPCTDWMSLAHSGHLLRQHVLSSAEATSAQIPSLSYPLPDTTQTTPLIVLIERLRRQVLTMYRAHTPPPLYPPQKMPPCLYVFWREFYQRDSSGPTPSTVEEVLLFQYMKGGDIETVLTIAKNLPLSPNTDRILSCLIRKLARMGIFHLPLLDRIQDVEAREQAKRIQKIPQPATSTQ